MNSRRNVRASLHEYVRIRGTDRWGNPFDIQGESTDFSRKGLGLLVDRDIMSPGSVLTLDVPHKLRSNAVVQWARRDAREGFIRVGLRLVNPQASFRFRLAACFLLTMAIFSQVSMAKPRTFQRVPTAAHCTVGLAEMKTIIDSAFSKIGFLTEGERAFLKIQHERMPSEEYARWLGGFFRNEKKKAAAMAWYQNNYQAQDQAIRSAAEAVAGSESAMGGTQ